MIDRKLRARVLLAILTFFPFCVLAATGGDTQMMVTPQQKEILDLFKWGLGIIFVGQFFWIRKYMIDNEKKHDEHKERAEKQETKHDDDTREITRNLSAVSAILHELHGEHKSRTNDRDRRETD